MTSPVAYGIGVFAVRVRVTTRTISYHEQVGLFGTARERAMGTHRLYGEADVARLEELVRLRDPLGLSLDELEQA